MPLTDVVHRGRGHPTPTLLRGHNGCMTFVDFLSNDQIISASDEDSTIRRWTLSDGRNKVVKELMVCAVAISPNKRWVAVGGRDGRLRLLDLEVPNAEVVKSVGRHSDLIKSLSFSPDASQLASGARDGKVLVWSSATLKQVAGPFKGHMDSVWSICYSPDGKKIASCDREVIQIWDSTATTWVGLAVNEKAWSLAWSPDGNSIFAGCIDGTIKRYDPSNGALQASYMGHSDVVFSIILSRNANFIVTASWDKTVRLWELTTFQQHGPTLQHDAKVCSVSISPHDSHLVSAARDSNLRVWDLRTIAPALFGFFPLEPIRGLVRLFPCLVIRLNSALTLCCSRRMVSTCLGVNPPEVIIPITSRMAIFTLPASQVFLHHSVLSLLTFLFQLVDIPFNSSEVSLRSGGPNSANSQSVGCYLPDVLDISRQRDGGDRTVRREQHVGYY